MVSYYSGTDKRDTISYVISQVAANEGGNAKHLDLFNYLLKPSFGSYSLKDMRCPSSLLFTLPTAVRYLLAWRLYKEEILLDKGKSDRATHPSKLMLLHSSVLNESLSPLYLAFEFPSNIYSLLGIKRLPHTDNVRQDCLSILQGLALDSPYLLEALEGYDRVYVIGAIAKELGYKEVNVSALQTAANYIYV